MTQHPLRRLGLYFIMVVVLVVGSLAWGGVALKRESDRRVSGEHATTVALCHRAQDNRQALVNFINFTATFVDSATQASPTLTAAQKADRHGQIEDFRAGALKGLPAFKCEDL